MKWYFFRHGITFESKNGLSYGANEETAQILPEARKPLEKIGNFLKDVNTSKNLTSKYKRCLETVAIVSKFSGKKFLPDDSLGEYRPDKESMNEFLKRMTEFIKKHNALDTNMAICSHGYPLQAMIEFLHKGTVNSFALDPYPNTGVLTIFEDGDIEVLDFN